MLDVYIYAAISVFIYGGRHQCSGIHGHCIHSVPSKVCIDENKWAIEIKRTGRIKTSDTGEPIVISSFYEQPVFHSDSPKKRHTVHESFCYLPSTDAVGCLFRTSIQPFFLPYLFHLIRMGGPTNISCFTYDVETRTYYKHLHLTRSK